MDNPFMQLANPMILTMETDAESAATIELLCEDLASSIARLFSENGETLTVVFDAQNRPELDQRLARLTAHSGVTFAPNIVPLASVDWAAQVAHDFPPMRIGRFYVAGSHSDALPPVASIPLMIDASAAFGTGEHATTEGCLRACLRLHKQRRFTRLLDMGCGTAILAIGMQKLWRKRVLAIDNDAVAVRVARVQAKQNRLMGKVRCEVGNGYHHRLTATHASYDLIVANILARPLMKMARQANGHLARDGVLVLSGLLHAQEPMVLAAHRYQGLYMRKRLRIGKWSILTLSRRTIR